MQNPYGPGTPTRLALELVAHKWALLVLKILQGGPTRFSALRRHLEGISPQVLTRTLRELERDGMITRQIFAEVPPRVEYSLTDLGHTLCPVIEALRVWAEQYIPEVLAARQRVGPPAKDVAPASVIPDDTVRTAQRLSWKGS